MVVSTSSPAGCSRSCDVLENGYWHARSPAFLDQRLITTLAWARLPADIVFIVLGALPLFVATVWTYVHARKSRPAVL